MKQIPRYKDIKNIIMKHPLDAFYLNVKFNVSYRV